MLYLLLAAEEGGHGVISPLDLFHPANHKAAFWALGIFILLVFVLKKLAWTPIVAGLNAREDRIAESLKKAEEIEKATAELAETNRKTLEEAQQKAQQIIADAREASRTAGDEIMAKARAEIEASRDRAKREVALEMEKARSELRAETVNLTVAAASRLVGRSLSGDDQRRLAMEALRDAEDVARN